MNVRNLAYREDVSKGAIATPLQGDRLVRFVAIIAAVIALLPIPGGGQLSASAALCAALAPVIYRTVRRSTLLSAGFWISAMCLLVPPIQRSLSGSFPLNPPGVFDTATLPIALWLSLAILAWCAEQLGARTTLLLCLPVPAVFDLVSRGGLGNVWKYAIAVWVVAGVLTYIDGKRRVTFLLGVVAIVAVSAAFDTRNVIVMVMLSAAVGLVSTLRGSRSRRFVIGALVGCAILIAALQLAISGALGAGIQITTKQQMSSGPISLLRDARPESAGNLSLIAENPLRVPDSSGVSSREAAVIRSSFSGVDRDPFSQYVTVNVISRAEFHSVAVDAWFHMGLAGVISSIALASLAIWMLASLVRNPYPLAVLASFGALRILWDLLFSPVSDTRFWPIYLLAFWAVTRLFPSRKGL